jgi:N-acetyltransferase
MLKRQAGGADLPFAVRHLESRRLAGATRFLEIRPAHRALEIGGTWYGLDFQRTAVNTESKYLCS